MSTRTSSSYGTPSEPNVDDMANNWGTCYVPEDFRYDNVSRTKFDTLIRKAIPNFRLLNMVDSGTTANDKAILMATSGNYQRLLVGMGSYCGGNGFLHLLKSSTMVGNYLLSMVESPEKCNEEAQKITIALPYHVPCMGLDDKELQEVEDKCLIALKRKLMYAKISGMPFSAFLLE